jgi:hypothetical protein
MFRVSRPMNTATVSNPASRRRRIRYIDQGLQKWLVVAVVLEVAAAAAAVGLLYLRLSGLIEDNLYRVHFAAVDSMAPTALHDGLMLMLAFVAINVLALLTATVVWGRYVGNILRDFVAVIEKTLRMDFSEDTERQGQHEVLALAGQWRAKERERLAAISAQVGLLNTADADAGEQRATPEVLRRLRELLR